MISENDTKDNNGDEDIEIVNDDEAPSSASGGDDGRSLKAQIEELKKERLYLLADFDNYRKQAIKERSDILKYAAEPVFREFLTVLDNLERAASTELTPETMETYKSGVELIVTQFKKALEKFGVEEINPLGQSFDPALHEALGSEEKPGAQPNSVTQVLNKAYKLKGKVIRPAQVIVNSSSKQEE